MSKISSRSRRHAGKKQAVGMATAENNDGQWVKDVLIFAACHCVITAKKGFEILDRLSISKIYRMEKPSSMEETFARTLMMDSLWTLEIHPPLDREFVDFMINNSKVLGTLAINFDAYNVFDNDLADEYLIEILKLPVEQRKDFHEKYVENFRKEQENE